MKTNFKAMLTTANEKYTSLLNMVYRLKSGQEIDPDKLMNLIHSVYMDEAELIFELCSSDRETKNEMDEDKIIHIPSFMHL